MDAPPVRPTRSRLGGLAGIAFAVLTVVSFAIAPGPPSAAGVAVVSYFSTHATQARWQAVLVGVALMGFIWFTGAFAAYTSSLTALVASAVTAALYLVAIGAWETLGETYGGTNGVGVSSSGPGQAHVLYDVGVGAIHLAAFAVAILVASTAIALIDMRGSHRLLGSIGLALAVVQVLNAALQVAAESRWSDIVGNIVFLSFVAWIIALSVVLLRAGSRAGSVHPEPGERRA